MQLEHANVTVTDLERSIRFYTELLGMEVRWRGVNANGEPAVHLAIGDTYLALFQAVPEHRDVAVERANYGRPGINHLGFVVDDLDLRRERLGQLGIPIHFEPEYEPGRRLYFHDPDGIEVELVSYAAPKDAS